MKEEERIEWIDIAKGIGIICVVMGHIFSIQMLAHKIIYLFHMPLFFYISGFLYKGEQRNGKYIVKKLKSLIVPYFSVFIFVYLLFLLIYFPKDYSPEYIKTDITYYILGGRFLRRIIDNVFVAMWFVTCLFVVQVFYNFIQSVFSLRTVHIIVAVLLAAAYVNSLLFPDFRI
jgi:fucose 4-O-acetylase-like acetyltransferase